MPEWMSIEHLRILQHALGIDEHGRGPQYRNFFCAGGSDETICRELVSRGMMRQHATTEMFPYFNCSVTEDGRAAVSAFSPPAPRLTRSKLRYRRYLDWADAFDGTFREFLEYEKKERAHA